MPRFLQNLGRKIGEISKRLITTTATATLPAKKEKIDIKDRSGAIRNDQTAISERQREEINCKKRF